MVSPEMVQPWPEQLQTDFQLVWQSICCQPAGFAACGQLSVKCSSWTLGLTVLVLGAKGLRYTTNSSVTALLNHRHDVVCCNSKSVLLLTSTS